MNHTFKPSGVCPRRISFSLEGDVVRNIEFTGGCNGNLKAISALVEGLTVSDIAQKLEGNKCGRRTTSCADQLVKGLRIAHSKEQV